MELVAEFSKGGWYHLEFHSFRELNGQLGDDEAPVLHRHGPLPGNILLGQKAVTKENEIANEIASEISQVIC